MREIKFRGKSTETKLHTAQWRFGSLLTPPNEACKPLIFQRFSRPMHDGNGYWYEVEAETVGQYTGRKDRNGVLVFEGDLVELPNLGMTDKAPAEVVWNEDDAKFELFGYDTAIDFSNVYSHEIVVVGNIYENPELGKSRD